MTDRGQSETLGYVLVFSVILLTVGAVYTAGFTELEESRADTQIQNMERAFEVLSENLQDIYRDDAPRRATEIKLGEGQIGYGEQVYMRVNATAVGNRSNHSPALNVSITPVRYTLGDTAVVYSTGAIFVERGDSARMASRPDWLLDEDMVAISQVQTAPSVDTASLSGPGTILVTAAGGSPSVIEFSPGSRVRVNVTVKTPRTVAWKRAYQSEADAVWIDDAEGSVTLQFLADNATVVRTGVSVGLQT